MSFLSGTTTLTHETPIPAPVRKPTAVARLHDHEFFLRCDPHYTSHTALPPPDEQQVLLPADLELVDGKEERGKEKGDRVKVRVYEVVDHVPNPVWSSDVVSREELADLKTGLWVRLKSVLGVVMETRWLVEGEEKEGGAEGEGEQGLRLVQVVTVSCSRVLMPLVRAQVEGGWKGIHEKIVRGMVEDAEAEGK
ncbi:hypothetical protein F5X96DRAFT_652437 [Biscogniauxia mediterranea]|nr:hypothetical protein F5X96DRAFT_652437 [Biscogniauxia mediterranea]